MGVPAARFWTNFNPAIAQSLSAEQRTEIERVISLDPTLRPGGSVGDFRVSCLGRFVRVLWGREKRSAERLQQESAANPAISKKNAPALVTMGVAYVSVWYVVLVIGAATVTAYMFG